MIEAHCGMLLPRSSHLTDVVEALPYTGPIQVTITPVTSELYRIFLKGGTG